VSAAFHLTDDRVKRTVGVKNEDDRREAMSMARTFLSARENAQRCAVDCAPYVHAKLQAVHHEHGPTGRYIIADRPMTEAEWIRERATVIDVTPGELSTARSRRCAQRRRSDSGQNCEPALRGIWQVAITRPW
jgi:hypothetical protein